MNVIPFPSGPFETNAYIVICTDTHHCMIVDPAPESAAMLSHYVTRHKLSIESIVLTHSHWDHIADVAEIKKKFPVPVAIHSLDVPNLEHPGSDGLPCWIQIQGVKPDVLLKEGDVIKVGNLIFEVIHTPGHTPGGICLHEKNQKVLLSGDTLFHGSIGNLSFPTAQPHLMWGSLEKLIQLPWDTKVYPGHGAMTTIGAETWLPNAKRIFG